MTKAELSDRLGVSMASICYWEQDRSRPKPARIEALAEALNVAAADLLVLPAPVRGPNDFQHLIARARAEIASAAGTTPAKVRIVIEM